MSDIEVHDAEVVDETASAMLEPAAPRNLFRSDDPTEVLARATEVANALAPVIKERGLFANIKGRQHITVEGWQTLGAMLGVTPVCTWTRKLEDGWEARVESRTLDGRVVGAAEAECLRAEGTWKDRDDFALRSMAQTRATSKALASVLRFVVTLSGFEGTPAEEMPRDGGIRRSNDRDPDAASIPPSDKQLDFIASLSKKLGADGHDESLIRGYASEELTGGKKGSASKVIEKLKGEDAGEDAGEFLLALAEQAQVWQSKQSDAPPDVEGLEQQPLDESGVPWEPARG